jgi:hypothetical protein
MPNAAEKVTKPAPEAHRSKPLLSYPLHIGGKDVEGVGWVYTVSSKSLLEDVFTSVSLKRALEKDPDPRSAAAQHRGRRH